MTPVSIPRNLRTLEYKKFSGRFGDEILVAECREWVVEHGGDPQLKFKYNDWVYFIELPEGLAVEFTLRWL